MPRARWFEFAEVKAAATGMSWCGAGRDDMEIGRLERPVPLVFKVVSG